jgi:integrase
MRVYRRGDTFWMDLSFEGQRIRKSTGMTSLKSANAVASLTHAEMVKSGLGVTKRIAAPTLTQAAKLFIEWSQVEHRAHPGTTQRYQTSCVPLLKHFGSITLDKILPESVEEYKAMRLGQVGQRTGRALRPATVNRELAAIRAIFNHAAKKHHDLRNPVSKLSGVRLLAEQNEQDRVLTFTEQRAYLAKASPTLRDIAGLILELGLRPAEAYSIEKRNVHLDQNFLFIPIGKTPAARRRLPLTSAARNILMARLAANPERWLFPCETDPTRPLPKINNAHDRAVKAAQLKPFKLYACRHSWATRIAEAGVDLITLASLLGHSKLAMVMRYSHPSANHQASAVAKLERHNALREMEECGDATTIQ